MAAWLAVLLTVAVRGASTCELRAVLDVGGSIQATDASLCSNGTLTLLRGNHSWGSSVLRNVAVIDGNYSSITGSTITFLQNSVSLYRSVFHSSTLISSSLSLRDSRITFSRINVNGESLLVENVMFVGVNCTANSTTNPFVQGVTFAASIITASNLRFGTGPSRVVVRGTQITDTTLVVNRTLCEAAQRVTLEACTCTRSNILAVDGITGGCGNVSSLEVSILGTYATGGNLSVISVLEFPIALSIVNSSFDTVNSSVLMMTVSPPGTQPQTLLLIIRQSYFLSSNITVMANGTTGPHIINVTVQQSWLYFSSILLQLCSIESLAVSSLWNTYSGNGLAIAIDNDNSFQDSAVLVDFPPACRATVLFNTFNDTFLGTQLRIDRYRNVSLNILGLTSRDWRLSTNRSMIDVYSQCSVIIESSKFMNGTASTSLRIRGANYEEPSRLSLLNCTFSNIGGSSGLEVANGHLVSIVDCTFTRSEGIQIMLTLSVFQAFKVSILSSRFSTMLVALRISARPTWNGTIELARNSFDSMSRAVGLACSYWVSVYAEDLTFTRIVQPWEAEWCPMVLNLKNSKFIGNGGKTSPTLMLGPRTVLETVRLSNLTFTNNTVAGVLLDLKGAEIVEVTACSFIDNSAGGQMIRVGILYQAGGGITLTNCIGVRNKNTGATGNGGGFVLAATIVDYGGNYIGTTGSGNGGVFEATTRLEMRGTVVKNSSAMFGGAAWGYSVFITDSIFSGCRAGSQGGAVWAFNSTIMNVTFEDCSSAWSGGSVFAEVLSLTSAHFTRCRSDLEGGAVSAKNAVVRDSKFADCRATDSGGSVSAEDVDLRYSSFIRSYSMNLGGALYSKRILASHAYFESCSCEQNGGAVAATHLIVVLDSEFQRCAAQHGLGGGIYSLVANISSCHFNYSVAAGAAAVYSSSLTSYNTTIENGYAAGFAGGYFSSVQCISVGDKFMMNWADQIAGALWSFDAHVTNAFFEANGAYQAGAVYSATSTFQECIFFANYAEVGAGVIHSKRELRLENVTMTFSNAGGFGAIISLVVTGRNVSFSRNWGTLFVVDDLLMISESQIISNYARQSLIDCDRLCKRVDFSKSEFRGNTGGGIFSERILILKLTTARLTFNRMGGYLFQIKGAKLVLDSVLCFGNSRVMNLTKTELTASLVVMGNNTENLVMMNSKASLRGILCYNNTFNGGNGSCLAIFDSDVKVYNLTAIDNVSDFGGDLFIGGNSSVQLNSSRFTRSRAHCGGSIWVESNVSITDCTFEATTARGGSFAISDAYIPTAPDPGAAISFVSKGNSLTMTRCNISGCRGGYGALAVIGVSDVALVDVVFNNNSAVYGGALALSSPTESRVSIVRGAALYNNATFGGVMITTPTVEITTLTGDWDGNTAFYGNTIALRAVQTSMRVRHSNGEEIAPHEGIIMIPVGVGVVFEFALINEENKTVSLGQEFTAKLSARGNDLGTTRFFPTLNNINGTIRVDGFVSLSSELSMTGDPGVVVPLALHSDLLPSSFNFSIKLAGCPQFYGLTDFIVTGAGSGKTCALCEKGQYSYGGMSKCFPCKDNMICGVNRLPVSTAGFWITPVRDNIVDAVHCPMKHLCLEGNLCAPGFNVTSLVCGDCVAGKRLWYGTCTTCENNYGMLAGAALIQLLIANLYMIFIQRTALPSPTASLKILMQFSQVAFLVVPEIPVSFTWWDKAGRAISGDTDLSFLPCFVKTPPEALFHLTGIFSAVCMALLVIHRVCWAKWRQRKGRAARVTTTYNSILSFLQMSVFSTTSAFLDFLSCVPVFEDKRVVIKSPSIMCSGYKYNFHVAILGAYCGVAWLALLGIFAKIIIDYRRSPSKTTGLWTFMFYHFDSQYPQREFYVAQWEYYRAQLRAQLCRWWLCVMIIRRFTLLIIALLVKSNKIEAKVAFPLVLVGFLYLHVMVRPYKSDFDDATDGIGILLLLIASLLSGYPMICYLIIITGSLVLVAYLLFDNVPRMWTSFLQRKRDESVPAEEFAITADDLCFASSRESESVAEAALDDLESRSYRYSMHYIDTHSSSEYDKGHW